MSSYRLRHAQPGDVAGAARVVLDQEAALYGDTTFTQSDLESEWKELELDRNVWVAEDATGIVGYASLQDRGALFRAEAYVHPQAANANGVAVAIYDLLERVAVERGARRLQTGPLEPDDNTQRILRERGYRAVRVFREMRIEFDAQPEPPSWPEGIVPTAFDRERDAHAFHAAHQEAFSDHWEYRFRPFDEWAKTTFAWDKYDPTLWCVARSDDEIVGGTINAVGLYGGGWVSVLFTRRPWRGRGVGGALLQDAFVRFWDRGERSAGLGVDAESDTGAFRVYERAGMKPLIGWVMHEKELGGAT